jgi:hypothetical protein
MRGFRSTEIEVTHHARVYGQSKYGVKRFLRGFMDMLTVSFLQNYRERPLHLFGGMAIVLALVGVATFVLGVTALSGTLAAAPFEIVGSCFAVGALPLMGLGFLSELLISVVPSLKPAPPVAEEVPDWMERAIPSTRSLEAASGPSTPREVAGPRPLAANDAVG